MERELPKKVGIMGGTFDPIHIGHLLLAQQACAQFALDKVLFMPSSQPPHKDTRQVTSAVHRQAMTKLAVQGNSRFIYSDLELLRTGTTYTSDTLTELHTRSVDASAWGMERIRSSSAGVIPLDTRAE